MKRPLALRSKSFEIIRWKKNSNKDFASEALATINEEPLSIRLEGSPYAVVMRTPGEEIAHVAGFFLAEGLVDRQEELRNIGFCDGDDTNTVAVTLSENRRRQVDAQLDRRGYISQTSCGICGKEVVEDLVHEISPMEDETVLPIEAAAEKLASLSNLQPLREKTRAAHAAVLYSVGLKQLAAAEDVGRHNALDKAVGKLFLDGRLPEAKLLVLSSRISYELVQKAARARIPVILAMSRPTALAVSLAMELNMTVACHNSQDGALLVYSHPRRLLPSK